VGDGSSLQGVANTTNAAGRGSGPHCPPAAGSSSEDPPLSFSDRLPVLAGDLIDRVTATGLLEPGRSVLVLLSGGRDSVCLLDLAVRIVGSANVAALHCNYGLRQAAEADERHCAGLCERLGVSFHVRRPRPVPATGNLQAWARDTRYGAAIELTIGLGGDIAAGHTASDQVETVLYRLAASPGRRALLGMAARDGRLVRPLLGVSREETATHCTARGLEWREDVTNEASRFARNRVRHELLPALRSLHPAAEANVLSTLRLLRDEAAVLDGLVDEALARCASWRRRCAGSRCSGSPTVPRAAGRRRSGIALPRCWRSATAVRSTWVAGCASRCAAARCASAPARARRRRAPTPRAPRMRAHKCCATPASERSSSRRTTCGTACASSGRRSRAITPTRTCS
jgi:tRNA(Ile)-lysidine synthase